MGKFCLLPVSRLGHAVLKPECYTEFLDPYWHISGAGFRVWVGG